MYLRSKPRIANGSAPKKSGKIESHAWTSEREIPMGSQKSNPSQPWLTPEGRLYSDEILQQISKSWSLDTWEEFLKETVDKPLKEIPITKQELDRFDESVVKEFWDKICNSQFDDEVSAYVRRVIRDHLTPKQQQLVRLIFWEGYSLKQCAECMALSKSTVYGSKQDILKKLKRLLERHPNVSPLSRESQQEGDPSEPTSTRIACESIRSEPC